MVVSRGRYAYAAQQQVDQEDNDEAVENV